MKTTTLMVAVTAGGLAVAAHGAIIAEDGFDYVLGTDVVGQSGGTGDWSGGWTNSQDNGGSHLTVAGLTAGNALNMVTTESVTDFHGDVIRRELSATVTDGTVWGSVYVSGSAVGAGDFFINFGNNGTVMIGKQWGTNFSINNTAGDPAISMGLDQTYHLLWRYEVSGGVVDTTMWIDPADTSSEAALGTAYVTRSGDSWQAADYVTIGVQRYGNQNIVFDELAFGTELSDVVIPEPSAVALLGLAGLGLVLRRRR